MVIHVSVLIQLELLDFLKTSLCLRAAQLEIRSPLISYSQRGVGGTCRTFDLPFTSLFRLYNSIQLTICNGSEAV